MYQVVSGAPPPLTRQWRPPILPPDKYTGSDQRAVDPANPSVLRPSAFIGNLVPGTGTLTNGMVADGYPGMRPGEYFNFTPFVAAPR